MEDLPEDDDDEEKEPVEEPTVAEVVQAGVAQGQLDKGVISIDQRELDEAEEQLILQFAQDGCKCDLEIHAAPPSQFSTIAQYAARCLS